jgi:hypothetical protein
MKVEFEGVEKWYAVQVRFFFPFIKRKEEQNKFTTMMR